MERVLGIGGVFFRANDPGALAEWYETNLGIDSMKTKFAWEQEAGPTVFTPFPASTEYFGDATQQFMINFRVADLDAMITQLVAAGATVHDNRSQASYGRFVHVSDPEGNRFELWEPGVIPGPDQVDAL